MAHQTLSCCTVKRLVDNGVAGTPNPRLIIDDLTNWAVGIAFIDTFDTASKLCHISWRLVSSITTIPCAITTDDDAFGFEICASHCCAAGMIAPAGLNLSQFVPTHEACGLLLARTELRGPSSFVVLSHKRAVP